MIIDIKGMQRTNIGTTSFWQDIAEANSEMFKRVCCRLGGKSHGKVSLIYLVVIRQMKRYEMDTKDLQDQICRIRSICQCDVHDTRGRSTQ